MKMNDKMRGKIFVWANINILKKLNLMKNVLLFQQIESLKDNFYITLEYLSIKLIACIIFITI